MQRNQCDHNNVVLWPLTMFAIYLNPVHMVTVATEEGCHEVPFVISIKT